MCGIFGYVDWGSSSSSTLPDLGAAERSLSHRGPDGEGSFTSQAAGVRGGLAQTRLAIIDLSEAGKQPMVSQDGRYVIAYNGEVYNFKSVKHELTELGRTFRSSSDTEVVLESYAEWGPAALERLRGMFALAIWDLRLGHLFLARDRFGEKPLYLARSDRRLVFASELRTLLQTGAAERRLSAEGLRSYLSWGSVAEPHTIIEGITCLPPAHYLTARDGRIETRPFWTPSIHHASASTFEEAVETVRPVLREAVELRLVSDVPVGVFLSGGIDSSAISAIASQSLPDGLDAFTVTFNEEAMSEEAHARAVARYLNCRHHILLLRPEEAQSQIEPALGALDQPSADGINTYFVSKAVRSMDIKVVLSGLGGDELFAGYHYFRTFERALRLAGALPGSASRALEDVLTMPWLGHITASSVKFAQLLGASRTPQGAYAALRCMFTPRQVATLTGSRPSHDVDLDSGATAAWEAGNADPINLLTVLELRNYLKNTLLRDSDAMSMAHGLELRVPLLDHRLVEAVLRVPGRTKLGTRLNKPLLVAASPDLPNSAVERRKMGFTLPFESWLRGALRPMAHTLLTAQTVSALGLDADSVRTTWNAFLQGDRRVTFSRVWCLLALVAWCERWGVVG